MSVSQFRGEARLEEQWTPNPLLESSNLSAPAKIMTNQELDSLEPLQKIDLLRQIVHSMLAYMYDPTTGEGILTSHEYHSLLSKLAEL